MQQILGWLLKLCQRHNLKYKIVRLKGKKVFFFSECVSFLSGFVSLHCQTFRNLLRNSELSLTNTRCRRVDREIFIREGESRSL